MKMRIAGSVLALSMLASTPASVFAETYKKDGQVYTTDWSDEFRKTEEAETGNWALSKKNRLLRVSPADPVKTPDINYVGVYTNTDGREVVRFSFNAAVASDNQWDKLLLKLPKAFDDMVDHYHPFNGIYKGVPKYGAHDAADQNWEGKEFSEAKAVPDALAWNVAGSQNVYSFDLYKNGSMGVQTHPFLPIDFVLKQGQSIKNLKADALVQARLTDKKYERVYARAGEINNDYMQYTMTTIIPKNKNYGIDVNTDLSNVGLTNPAATYNKFFSTVSSVKFNVEKGYLEVYHRQNKWLTGSGYALRQSVGSDFYDLLEERDGMVGEVYIMGADAKPFSPPKGQPYEPSTKIQFAKSDINTNLGQDIGFLQVAGSDWDTTHEYEGGIKTKKSSNVKDTAAILNSTTAQFNGGVYTVVRYFIKPDQLKKLIKENGLKSYTFRTSILRPNESQYTTGNRVRGISEYTFTADKERNLKRGDDVKLKFDKAQYNRVAATYTTLVEITVGDDNYNIPFRNTISYDRSGLEATWKVPFDIKIKKGETIKVKSVDWDEKNRATKLAMYFSDNDIQEASPKVNYSPIEMLRSASLTGGALISTIEKPNVNEIFTDDKAITGHSIHEGAEINISFPGIKKQTLSAIAPEKADEDGKFDYSTIMTPAKKVNKENVMAFPFDTSKPNQGGYVQAGKKHDEFKMPELVKDMRVTVDNLAGLSSFIPSDSVDEKVQAKVKFDLNEGKLPTTVKSFEGYDNDIKSDERYKVVRADEKASVTRIVPMNKKYADEEGYQANGFVGENASDRNHDGLELKGNEKALREFVKEEPTKEGAQFLGWTTQKLEGTPEEVSTAFKALQEATTADQVNGEGNFVFTDKTPVTKGITVYAAYGLIESAVYNPVQKYDEANDKQYIEAIPEEEGKTLPEGATYKIVKKNADGTYTPVEGVTQTTKEDGTPVFDITGEDSPVKHGDEIYIETKETGKDPSYSTTPVTVDKQGPSFIGDGENDLVVTQDPQGYQVTVAATAKDDAGILRFYLDDKKVEGYNPEDASQKSGGFEATLQNQQGEEKTVTVTAVDKLGNKSTATHTFKPQITQLDLSVREPRSGRKFVIVTSSVGAEITIKRGGGDIVQKTLKRETDRITVNSPLNAGEQLEITATLNGSANVITTEVK